MVGPSSFAVIDVPRACPGSAAVRLRSVAPTLTGVGLSVLGPLRLDGPAGTVVVPGRKAREALTLLALAAPRPMPVGVLADRL